jgi:predicted transposase
MEQSMLLKLAPTEDQQQALLDMMHAFNAACNYVAVIALSA